MYIVHAMNFKIIFELSNFYSSLKIHISIMKTIILILKKNIRIKTLYLNLNFFISIV